MMTPAQTPAQEFAAKIAKYVEKSESNRLYLQVQRNAIWYHRNQIRFFAQLHRERGGLNSRLMACMKSHAAEIKQIFAEINSALDRTK